jgi:hypothetical protein
VPVRSPRPPAVARVAALISLLALLLLPAATPVAAAEGLTMEARVLFEGHARLGSWMAIAVHLENDGPAVTGELRLAGGAQGRTRFSTPVDLPTQSKQDYFLYAQPPAFGRDLEIQLVSGDTVVSSVKTQFTVRDPNQLVVGIVAERPQGIVAGLDLLPNQNQVAPVLLTLDPSDLPKRVEAWGAIDRLIWQDVDSGRLELDQREALRGWLAGGGRMVIVGGTTGPGTLSGFPDDILPYRPETTIDAAPASLSSLLSTIPDGATDVVALSGALTAGRALATVGDRVVAAELAYGSGIVTILGFDPATPWITETKAAEGMWRRLLPPRTATGLVFGDDNQLVNAVSQLPALALPPIGGLLALLGGYIVLIGPVNYLVLRRLDRREWAWITMPALIAVFAVGAYGFGAALRGSDVIVNEVAIVRGSPGTTVGSAQVYLGVFSPTRGTYQLEVPGGALLSAPISGDFFGGDGLGAALDVLQGEPARVRDLAVGFGSLRAIRAETAVDVPLIEADLRLVDGRLRGTIKNASDQVLSKPAVVLGANAIVLGDLAPGAEHTVDMPLQATFFGQSLSDKVVGPVFFGDPSRQGEETQRQYVRHMIVDQLTYDPMFGTTNQLSVDGPVVLAWGSRDILPVEIAGQEPRRTGNVLYYLPTSLEISGTTTFRQDLMRSTVVETDANFFSKDPFSLNFGRGTATLAYRPIAFEGAFTPTELVLNLAWGGDTGAGIPSQAIDPLDEIPPPCDPAVDECRPPLDFDGLPEVEIREVSGSGEWRRLPRLRGGNRYSINHPERYVDPATGTVLLRFVNEVSEGVGFSMNVELTGEVR